MKSHERREVDRYSASQWLLEYPQITIDYRKAWLLNKHFHLWNYFHNHHSCCQTPSIFFSVNAPESVSHVNTLRHWVGRRGTRRGWRCFCFIAVFEISKKRACDRHSFCMFPARTDQSTCMHASELHSHLAQFDVNVALRPCTMISKDPRA